MNSILIIGAGRSATVAIDYVLKHAKINNWQVTIADRDIALANDKVKNHNNGKALALDINNEANRQAMIGDADLVISLLPASMHHIVAKDCLALNKHLITASYVSDEMAELGKEARKKGLIFMGELGLDPGLDHMSALEKIDEIKAEGGKLNAFRSYTGGLIAPECDNNPWHYKFTWNPRNVVLAGRDTAQYLKNGNITYVPYPRLFNSYILTDIKGMGQWEVYANRDSLSYREIYRIEDVPNILRGTIRHKGFCEAWAALVKIGLTDTTFTIHNANEMTYRQLTESFVYHEGRDIKDAVADLIHHEVGSETMNKLEWLGLFDNTAITTKEGTPADILLDLLLPKWSLDPNDNDMILMKHEFEYTLNGENRFATSTLIMKGDDSVYTAMAKTVGLPLAIFARLVMEKEITSVDVQRPVVKEIYAPILRELENYDIKFIEEDYALTEA